jgi:hypothetical protein
MPPLIAALPAIAAIASIAGTGVTVGETLANQPGAPKPPAAAPGPTPAQQAQTRAQQQAAVTENLPTFEAETMGAANPAYYAMLSALSSGVAGQPGGQNAAQRAVAQSFGFPALPTLTPSTSTSNTSVPPTPTALSDFVNSFFRG